MSNGFLKFKRNLRAGAILCSLLTGVSLGLLVFAVLWLAAKLANNASPDFLTYALCGVGAAGVACGLLLAVLLPTDRRLAKKLDNKLQLKEKIQTMVAFRGEDRDMVQLQREDADSILQQIPVKRMRSKSAWTVLILPVLACVCLIGTSVINAEAINPPKPPVDTSWYLDDYDEVRLKELIERVRTSDMEQVPRDGVVAQLQALLELLDSKTIRTESKMKEAVVQTIANIHEVVRENNSYHAAVDAMSRSVSEAVKSLSIGIRALDGAAISERIGKIKESFGQEGRGETAAVIATALNRALTEAALEPEDELHVALKALADALGALTDEVTDQQLDAVWNAAELALQMAVITPLTNESVETDTINRLMEIFDIPKTMLPPDITEDFEDGELSGKPSGGDDEEKENNTQGGLGNGETQFGSNDTIYDPIEDDWVSYGTVLQRYNAIVLEYATSEQSSDEIEQLLTTYYAILQDGTKKGE